MATSTIGNDVQVDADDLLHAGDDDIDSAAEALLKRWNVAADKKQPSTPARKEPAERAQEETEEHEAESGTEHEESEGEEGHEAEDRTEGEDDESGEEGEKAETKLASDDHEVEVTVEGETRRVPIKDLKRLFGQEASLTRKSQEVAQQRKAADELHGRHVTALTTLVKRAEDKWAPYSKIDFLVAQQNLSKEEFAQLRRDAQAAYTDVQYFKEELGKSTEEAQKTQHANLAEAARECVKVLEDPDKGIKGFGPKMYDEIRTFGIDQGIPEQMMNTIVNPAAIKIMHMAMQYAKAQKVGVKKVATAPKNVAKTKTTDGGAKPAQVSQRKAMDKLRSSGEIDDAAEAFLSRWNVK